MDNLCWIPVSFGELVDKITILEIKAAKISDQEALDNVNNELGLLMKEYHMKEINVKALKNELSVINQTLWDLEDKVRVKTSKEEYDDEFIKIAKDIHETNDHRYRVKREINVSLGSQLIEEKSYTYGSPDIQINVINLEYRPEKMSDMETQFESRPVNIIRFNAIVGKSVQISDRLEPLKKNLRSGEIGCFLSHTKLWEICLKNKDPFMLIAEDDIELPNDFSIYYIMDYINKLTDSDPEWDILFLSKTVDQSHDATNIGLDYGLPVLTDKYPHSDIRIQPRCGLHFYAISKNGAKKFLSTTAKLKAPIDVQYWYSEVPVQAYIIDKALVSEKIEYCDTYTDSLYMKVKRFLENNKTIQSIHHKPKINKGDRRKIRQLIRSVNEREQQVKPLLKLANKYPKWFIAHHYLAKSYIQVGDYAKALKYYKISIKLNPTNTDANLEYTRLLFYTKSSTDEIVDQWLVCHILDKYNVEPILHISSYLFADEYNPQYTVSFIEKGLKIDKQNIQLLNLAARTHERLGNKQKALECHLKCLAIKPDNAKILYNVGLLIAQSEKHSDNCIQYLTKSITLDPTFLQSYDTLAKYYTRECQYEMAVKICQKGLKMNQSSELLYQCGKNLVCLAQFDRAESYLKEVPKEHSDYGKSLLQLALVYKYRQEWDKAKQLYDDIYQNRHVYFNNEPDLVDFVNSYGHYDLLHGEYMNGYSNYFSIFGKRKLKYFGKTFWDGSTDKHVLVYNSGGFGDALMFCRYIDALSKTVKKVTLFIDDKLYHLFQKSIYANYPNVDIIRESFGNDFDYDCHCDVMQISYLLGISKNHQLVPYLNIEHVPSTNYWNMIKTNIPAGINVLFHWHGNRTNNMDKWQRSIPLSNFVSLFELENINWITVQRDHTEEEDIILKSNRVYDLSGSADHGSNAFIDTIDLLRNIDLVITTDTSMAHLCGTLQVKTWCLVTAVPEWRWGLEGTHCPWYPTMRIFRQKDLLDWSPVVKELKEELIK